MLINPLGTISKPHFAAIPQGSVKSKEISDPIHQAWWLTSHDLGSERLGNLESQGQWQPLNQDAMPRVIYTPYDKTPRTTADFTLKPNSLTDALCTLYADTFPDFRTLQSLFTTIHSDDTPDYTPGILINHSVQQMGWGHHELTQKLETELSAGHFNATGFIVYDPKAKGYFLGPMGLFFLLASKNAYIDRVEVPTESPPDLTLINFSLGVNQPVLAENKHGQFSLLIKTNHNMIAYTDPNKPPNWYFTPSSDLKPKRASELGFVRYFVIDRISPPSLPKGHLPAHLDRRGYL